MSPPLAPLAGAVLLAHLVIMRLLRRGRARSLRRGRYDRRTTLLLYSVGVVFIGAWIALEAAGATLPWPVPYGPGLALVALVPVATALRAWAMHALGECFTRTLTVHEGQELVTSGPYAWIRHPGYLAQLVAFPCAAAGLSGSLLPAALLFAALGAAYLRRIRVEEEMLVAELGPAYAAYRERTAKLVPGVY